MTPEEKLADQVGVIDGCLHQLLFHMDQLRKGITITRQHLEMRQHLLAFGLPEIEAALQSPVKGLEEFEAAVAQAKDRLLKALHQSLQG